MDELFEGLGYPVVDLPPAACQSRDTAVAFLTEFLVRGGRLPESDAPATVARILRREQLGSTALGNGVALPHLSCGVEHAAGVVGRAAVGIPWEGAADGDPVRHVCLLLTPASRPQETLLAQERVVRHLFRSPHAREQAIRLRAYRLWEQEGRPAGTALDYWVRAERELVAEDRRDRAAGG